MHFIYYIGYLSTLFKDVRMSYFIILLKLVIRFGVFYRLYTMAFFGKES